MRPKRRALEFWHRPPPESPRRARRAGRTQRAHVTAWLSFGLLAWAGLMAASDRLAEAQPVAPTQSGEGEDVNREYAIKAAYMYNFGRYVQWPPESFPASRSPFVIGVLGNDPFGTLLDEIVENKKIEGRPIVAKRFASMAQYQPCHILFVASSVAAQEKQAALRVAQGAQVLLIGEDPGFAEKGATINFFLEQNKIRFEINTEVAKREQLKISSKLLSLAKIVGRN